MISLHTYGQGNTDKMKKLLIFFVTALVGAGIYSCTKEGPQGPPGEDGEDANATCTQCHNFSDTLVARISQYEHSQHATGSTVYENGVACAPCHTSQGFKEIIQTGDDSTAAVITDPAPINCRTCHKIHETYTTADYALRYNSAIPLRIGGILDLSGGSNNSNLCSKCHQPRMCFPWPDSTFTQDSVYVTSDRFGPHHGTQSAILAGLGAWELSGSTGYASSPHRDSLSCTDCHGSAAVGVAAGGHTLRMTWLSSGQEMENTEPCQECHSGLGSFDFNGIQTEIRALDDSLKSLLLTKGWITSSDLLTVPRYYTKEQLQVIWNWFLVHNDRSYGVHNYRYSRDILRSGIDYVISIN